MNNYIDGVTIFTSESQRSTGGLTPHYSWSADSSLKLLTDLFNLMHSGNTLLPPVFCSHPFNILQTPSSSSPLDGEFMGHPGDRA